MEDRIGIRIYPINVTPVTGLAQQRVLARLDKMERNLGRVLTAVRDMRNAVRQGTTGASHANLASAVMNSRNWVLTVVADHNYVQQSLYKSGAGSGGAAPGIQAMTLYERAARLGVKDAGGTY